MYREENDWNSQRHCHQHSQSNTQHQDVFFIVHLQKLRIHICYTYAETRRLLKHLQIPQTLKSRHLTKLSVVFFWISYLFLEVLLLTIEGEVAKDGSQQVHDKHGQNRDISNILHPFLGWTGRTRRKKMQMY